MSADPYSNAMANAVEIGHHLPSVPGHMGLVDQCIIAATLMGELEDSGAIKWEAIYKDWSETCAEIAQSIALTSKSPSKAEIEKMILSQETT